jgi:hydrogenase nickel incorporation protein HypA/HybF
MHELSIASSILAIAQRWLPPRALLRRVRLIAGPMRAIEPEAMQFAWRAVTTEAGLDEVELQLDLRPWSLRCCACGREWTSERLDCDCSACGAAPFPVSGDELQVVSIEVEEMPASKGAPCSA